MERRQQLMSKDFGEQGAKVFSADDHVSISEDIFFQRFPQGMKDRAPRVWFDDGVYQIGLEGRSLLRPRYLPSMRLFDEVPGSASEALDERLRDLDAEGIDAELVFPNALPALWAHPDLEARELSFRIYNEYLAELQERANGRLFGVAMVNWWNPQGTRKTLEEAKSLGLRTFQMPLKAAGEDGKPIDWTSTAVQPIWDEIEAAGLPLSHHIGETTSNTEHNPDLVGFLKNTGGFRDIFAHYIFGGILDRHPTLRIGWFEAGMAWAASAIQDARLAIASYSSIGNWKVEQDPAWYWRNHMTASFIDDSLGLQQVDELGIHTFMWSADYPHSEGSIGNTQTALGRLAGQFSVEDFRQIVELNVKRYLGFETTS